MAVEMWAYKTDLGGLLPFYKVPYTAAQLTSFYSSNFGAPTKLMGFNNPADSNLRTFMPAPMLEDFRNIFKEGVSGGNWGAYLGNHAGTHRFLNQDGSTDGPTRLTISPGTINWTQTPSNNGPVEIGRNSGRFEDYQPGGWVLYGPANYVMGVRPTPQPGLAQPNGVGLDIPLVHALTSDGYFRTIRFFMDFNVYGWLYLLYESPSDTPFGVNYKPDFQAVHIKTLGEGDDDAVTRYNPRLMTSTVGSYQMDKGGVLEFLGDLWTTNTIESIRQVFIGDASNAILGLKWYYGLKDKVTNGAAARVQVGNVAFTGVRSFPIITSEFVTYDFGSISVPALHGNYLDYSSTVYKVYLPFVGLIDLNPQDVVGKTLYLRYTINMTDGSAVVQLSTTPTNPDGHGLLFSTTCEWGYDIPVRVEPGKSAVLATLRQVTGGMLFNGETPSYSAGSLTPNTSVMGDFTAKLIVYKKEDLTQDHSAAKGQPSRSSLLVSEASGYLKVNTVFNGGTLPARRAGDIMQQLMDGVYI